MGIERNLTQGQACTPPEELSESYDGAMERLENRLRAGVRIPIIDNGTNRGYVHLKLDSKDYHEDSEE